MQLLIGRNNRISEMSTIITSIMTNGVIYTKWSTRSLPHKQILHFLVGREYI